MEEDDRVPQCPLQDSSGLITQRRGVFNAEAQRRRLSEPLALASGRGMLSQGGAITSCDNLWKSVDEKRGFYGKEVADS